MCKKMILILSIIMLLSIFSNNYIFAEEPDKPIKKSDETMVYQFPLFDYPFNLSDGYSFPSMNQSLNLTKNTTQIVHSLLLSGAEYTNLPFNSCMGHMLIGIFDVFYLYLPPGYSWLHEEWHRAVMTNRKISSYNDVYKCKLFVDSISVSHVTDRDLIRLKAEHPADMVRLSAAGNEAILELNLAMKRDSFFSNRSIRYDIFSWWINTLNAVLYVRACTKASSVDSSTEETNIKETFDIKRRDFVGYDFTAWVYDLHRPYEPYAERGKLTNHLGFDYLVKNYFLTAEQIQLLGIDRYIKYSDLSNQEKTYIKLQGNLTLINFISPQMFGLNRFSFKNPFNQETIFWNFAMVHHLTSFGYTIDTNIFIKQNDYNWCFTYHSYMNKANYFPGIELSLVRYPFEISNYKMFLNCNVILWLQPEHQRFRTDKMSPGGLLKIGAALPIMKGLEWFVQIEGKTVGWVAGVVYLDEAVQTSTGINFLW